MEEAFLRFLRGPRPCPWRRCRQRQDSDVGLDAWEEDVVKVTRVHAYQNVRKVEKTVKE